MFYSYTLKSSSCINKAQYINAIYYFFFTQRSTNILLYNAFYRWILLDHVWVSLFTIISEQRRHSCVMLGKDDISVRSTRHFIFLYLRTREGLHAYHNKIKIDHCRGNPFQACLSKIAIDRDWPRFRYSRLGLFICWIGHNYPVPSSPPHTPRSGAHWPNRME